MDHFREMENRGRIYIGTSGHVLCINQADGSIVWNTELTSAMIGLLIVRDRIFAGGANTAACLNREDGAVVWKKKVKSLMAPVSLSLDMGVPGGILVVAGAGLLFGLSAESGEQIWDNGLKGLGYSPICLRAPHAVVADQSTHPVSTGKTTRQEAFENPQIEPTE